MKKLFYQPFLKMEITSNHSLSGFPLLFTKGENLDMMLLYSKYDFGAKNPQIFRIVFVKKLLRHNR